MKSEIRNVKESPGPKVEGRKPKASSQRADRSRRTLEAGAREVVERLHEAGFAAYWVGGSVRDFLLGREPADYDIATSAVPEQIERLFKRTIPVGKKFGVLVVVLKGHQYQVATFRAESDYKDG